MAKFCKIREAGGTADKDSFATTINVEQICFFEVGVYDRDDDGKESSYINIYTSNVRMPRLRFLRLPSDFADGGADAKRLQADMETLINSETTTLMLVSCAD